MIKDVFLGWATKRTSLLGREDFVVEGLFFLSNRAKQFTINVENRIGPDFNKDQIFVELYAKNDKFEVFVHDPRFFFLTYTPAVFPFLHRTFSNSERIWYPIFLTEVEELNLPQDPCNEDEKYNFQVFTLFLAVSKITQDFKACMSKSLTEIVGCKPKWEPAFAGDITPPNCTTVSQFRYLYEGLLFKCTSISYDDNIG